MTGDGYTPLHASILASSIWMEDDATRIVWMTMLALKDRHHFVAGSIPGLAHIARVSLEDCQRAITKFESPDKHSSNPDNEGRRIQRVPGGWFLLNGEHYQIVRDPEARREYAREWDKNNRPNRPNAKYRKKTPELPPTPPTHPRQNPTPPAQAEAEAEAEAEVQVHTPISKGTPMGGHNTPDRGGVSETVREKAKFEVDTRFRALKAWIEPFFKRPTARITDAEEVRLMAEVSRRPDLKVEIQLIDGLFRGLEDKSKFPRSVLRLLQSWQQKVDESRTCKSPVAAQEDRELKEILKPI